MVQHAVGTPHEADPSDAGLNRVRRLMAATPPIFMVAEHVLTVNAARALAVLFLPLTFVREPPRLQRHRRPGSIAQLHVVLFPTTASLYIAPQGVRVCVAVFVRLTLGEVYIGVAVVWVQFVPGTVGVAVILVAREPGSLSRVDAYDFLLVHLEADMTWKRVRPLQRRRGTANSQTAETL